MLPGPVYERETIGMTQRSNGTGNNQRPQSMIGVAIAIGAGGGVALGLVLDNLALGIAIGMAIGAALGAVVDRSRQESQGDE